jgi:hypothetical protein
VLKLPNYGLHKKPRKLHEYEYLPNVHTIVKGDVKEIQELKAYLEYQSTLAWLKTGVEGQLAPLDIMGGLDTIATAVQGGKYKSDYEVQYAIRQLLDCRWHYLFRKYCIKYLLT